MYRIHADRGCDRQEDRRENQNCGSQIQEHAHDEKEYVHDQEDDVSVAGNAHQSIGDRTRNAREGHNVGHDRGCRNQEQDGRGADHRICEHVIVIAEGDLTIADRKNRAVQDADNACLGRCEPAGKDTDHDNDDREQRRDRIRENLPGGVFLFNLGGRVPFAFSIRSPSFSS